MVSSAYLVVVIATHRSSPSFRFTRPGLDESLTSRPIVCEPVTTAASNSGLGADASNASMHEKRPTRSGTLANARHVFAASPRSGKPRTAHVPGVPSLAAITSHTTTAALRPLSLFSLDPVRPSSSRRLFTPDRDQVFPDASRSRPVTVVCQWAVTSSPASARKPSQIA